MCRVSGDGVTLEEGQAALTGYRADIFQNVFYCENDILQCKTPGVISVSGSVTLPKQHVDRRLPGEISGRILEAIRLAVPEIIRPEPSSKTLDLPLQFADIVVDLTLSFQPDPHIKQSPETASNVPKKPRRGKRLSGIEEELEPRGHFVAFGAHAGGTR